MRVLVVGSGGREHAIARKFAQSEKVDKVFICPGNVGMAEKKLKIVAISELDNQSLVDFAKKEEIDLTFVGPETALMNGIVDVFLEEGLRIFGPRADAAQIEGSKSFAKSIMKKYGVPTADYESFLDLEEALNYVEKKGAPIVIKADGLAAGKGVTVAMDLETARAALRDIFQMNEAKVVVEEYLEGEEFSLFSLVHEGKIYPLPIAQDHKRAFDGDQGPNTGGMGAYAPVPHIPERIVQEALERIVEPTIAGLRAENKSFTGVLYAGLIWTAQGVKTIEFNARFGDPETQVVLETIRSDFAENIIDILEGREPQLVWNTDEITLGVVVANQGYPNASTESVPLPDLFDLNCFYAGVVEREGQLFSSGGRVYMVTETGTDIGSIQKVLYAKLDSLDNKGMFYRTDIGNKGV
ncbi:phosphoribosylamine--glycine ligase [Lactococcus ileimucosae]|uniref:phosphoribosylamine--glycine ligase n=1 Tax=Lactococcus ileimucosae TaxID=2941329 RepID=UPI002043720E|nr:phosphoribosylamine--glycine ligase [Lactococcus ileimucosae]